VHHQPLPLLLLLLLLLLAVRLGVQGSMYHPQTVCGQGC
jgi:hypothetical protein